MPSTRFLPICLLVLLGAGTASAQDGDAALPAWEQLSPQQRETLIAPVRERWDREPDARAHMLRHAERWKTMTPEQRQRARLGMKRWEDMSPERRQRARVLFLHMRDLPEAEREALRERWKTMTPEERERWLEAHRPRE